MNALADATGRIHPRAAADARIVSLVPSVTELLFDLGLGPQVVGRTTFCIHPRDGVAEVPRVGGTKTPNLQRIERLGVSHVIVNVDENRREDAQALAAAGLSVIATHPQQPQDNLHLYRLLGQVFAREDEAQALCAEFNRALAELQQAAASRPRRRVLYLIWRKPWMTVSPATYIARCLAAAGLDTQAPDTGDRYPRLELDRDAVARVDAVLLSSEPYPFKHRHVREVRQACAQPRLPVCAIDGEMTSWYGSRAIAGCRYLARFAAELARH
jgi:ABC-type Fe3+-hydroxamate transport system substrate-binding protein